jgi:chromosome segregation ATPase
MDTGTLTEAEARLDSLAEERARIEDELSKAIEAASAEAMIKSQRALSENKTYTVAQKARVIQLRKAEELNQRGLAIAEREALEKELQKANQVYSDLINKADDARVVMQKIQVRLFSLDSRIENQRQSINDSSSELQKHLMRWRSNLMKQAGDEACSV